jgi:plastocyanin
MRIRHSVIISAGLAGLLACGSGSTYSTDPGTVGGTGAGPVGSVNVGRGIQFTSGHNGSTNPAVDTIPVGGTVTWTWSGSLPHSVQSVGSLRFESSGIRTASGTYAVTFAAPGVYQYNCAVHGQAMSGTLVVQ